MKSLHSFVAACLLVLTACDSEGDASVTDVVASACNPQITSHPILLSASHISPNEYRPNAFNSNPPSSGDHCGIWGEYTTFVNPPLPRCNYIHNLEHGAVVLLHNCPAGCSDVTTAFANLVKAFRGDALCKPARFVITPDALLANKIAAVAWGWTFTANCLDANATQMLSQFVQSHYGNGPEAVCSSGGLGP